MVAFKIKAAIAGVPTRAREVEGIANIAVIQWDVSLIRNLPFVHLDKTAGVSRPTRILIVHQSHQRKAKMHAVERICI